MKICRICKDQKPIEEFGRNKGNKDGIQKECKVCLKKYNHEYAKNNKEKFKLNNLKWQKENKEKVAINTKLYAKNNEEKIRIYNKIWRADNAVELREKKLKYYHENKIKSSNQRKEYRDGNKEKLSIKSRIYYEFNKNKIVAKVAVYRKSNPTKCKIFTENRRARKLKAGGVLSQGLAIRLFKLQRGKCPCCNQPLGTNYHLDHIMPLFLGGSNDDSNIQLLRQRCNNQKHAKHPVDFMQSRGFLL